MGYSGGFFFFLLLPNHLIFGWLVIICACIFLVENCEFHSDENKNNTSCTTTRSIIQEVSSTHLFLHLMVANSCLHFQVFRSHQTLQNIFT